MFNTTSGVPLTMNVAPVGNANGGGMFGDGACGGGWFWIIIIILLFGGWGGYGYGNGGFGGGAARETTSVYEGYVLNNDMSILNKAITDQTLLADRKFESVTNGLCDGFYTNAQLINGLDKSIASGTYAITNAIQQDTISGMQNTNALATQLADCCCTQRAEIKDVSYNIGAQGAEISRGVERGFSDTNYNLATQANGITTAIANGFCQSNFAAQTNTRDIVDAQNAGTRAILDKLCQMEVNAKDDRIAELTAANADLRLAASQSAQNQYIINQLRTPQAIPAYVVPSPYCNCNCNTGCGCGC